VSLLRSVLRVRFLWLPAVAVLFGAVLVGAESLPVSDGLGIVVAGFLTVISVLAFGVLFRLFG
jgi:hypothetical protein